MASYGARDRGLPGRAAKLEAALTGLGIEHDVKEYRNSGHEFMNRVNAGPALTPLMKFLGMNYVHEDAEDAWTRILNFLDVHLG